MQCVPVLIAHATGTKYCVNDVGSFRLPSLYIVAFSRNRIIEGSLYYYSVAGFMHFLMLN